MCMELPHLQQSRQRCARLNGRLMKRRPVSWGKSSANSRVSDAVARLTAYPVAMFAATASLVRLITGRLSVRARENASNAEQGRAEARVDARECKEAEDAAGRSEKELRDVIEMMPAMAWTALRDGSSRFVSRRWTEYTGLSAVDRTGSCWQAAVHPDEAERHVAAWRDSLATGAPFESEVRVHRCRARAGTR